MSRSQPKPKIIFKTLNELIKSSSLSKNSTITQDELYSNPSALRSITEMSTQSLKKSTSKHSLQSKQKPPRKDSSPHSVVRHGCSLMSFESLDSQIRTVYDEMETYLQQSKLKVINELKEERNRSRVEAKVKELQKMSDYLKHIIDVFTNQTTSEKLSDQNKKGNQQAKQNDCIQKLSRNQKKKSSSRYIHNSSNKKPSVYQKILNHLY